MIDVVSGFFLLMESCNCVGDEVHRNDIDAVRGPEGKRWKPGKEHERANHVELIRFWTAAIAQDDAGTKNGARHVRKQLPNHVLAELFCSRVGIVVRAVPIDRGVFLDYLIGALASNGDSTYVAEPAQSVLVARAHGQL